MSGTLLKMLTQNDSCTMQNVGRTCNVGRNTIFNTSLILNTSIFLRSDSPCELMCKDVTMPGTFRHLPETVMDGVRCDSDTGALKICLHGQCRVSRRTNDKHTPNSDYLS